MFKPKFKFKADDFFNIKIALSNNKFLNQNDLKIHISKAQIYILGNTPRLKLNSMNNDVFTLEQKFQPYLLNNDYTFVGPVDVDVFDSFIKIAHKINAIKKPLYTTNCTLSNTKITRKALQLLPTNAPIRVYVSINTKIVLHSESKKTANETTLNLKSIK